MCGCVPLFSSGKGGFFLAWYLLQSVDVNPCCVRTYEKTGPQLSCQLMNVNYLCVVSTYYIRVYVKYVLVYVDVYGIMYIGHYCIRITYDFMPQSYPAIHSGAVVPLLSREPHDN